MKNPRAVRTKVLWCPTLLIISAAAVSISCINSTPVAYPAFSRTVGPISPGLTLAWQRRDLGGIFAADDAGRLYTVADFGKSLEARSLSTGDQLWSIEVPNEYADIRSIEASDQAVVTVTTTWLAAYSPTDGTWLWATPLVTGHVSIELQLDGPMVRVYYGEEVIEVDITSGRLFNRYTSPALLWVVNNIEIEKLTNAQGMTATDLTTGDQVWSTNEIAFYRNEGRPPLYADASSLLVPTGDAAFCALDLQEGSYRWCSAEAYVSNLTISPSGQNLYALRSDYSLVELPTATGQPAIIATFLPKELPSYMQQRLFNYAVVAVGDMLFVEFGDSGDVFAFLRSTEPLPSTTPK